MPRVYFLFFQLRAVPTLRPCSYGSKACTTEALRALLSPAPESFTAQSAGLHHWTAAWPGGGAGGV